MVVFTCSSCGEPLKKNQVEKHYMTRCRSCNLISCVDCGKDFWGDEYKQHIKCISEEEKYSGKNYKPKANANKGQIKQEQWTQQIQEAIEISGGDPKLRTTLEKLKDYPNIPRKRSKFENFMQNSLNVHNGRIVEQIWDRLMTKVNKDTEAIKASNTDSASTTQNSDSVVKENEEEGLDKKKNNKRERKEERRKKGERKEKKDRSKDNVKNSDEVKENRQNGDEEKRSKKKKKRKNDDQNGIEMTKSKRMKTSEDEDLSRKLEIEEVENEQEEEEDLVLPNKKLKFDWEDVITSVLKSKGQKEITLKKLQKKVLAEYAALGGTTDSEVKLWAKFNKKVTKNPKFKVLKDRVKLSS